MVGIRLFDAATRESTSRMDFGLVMQSAESVLDKFEQLVKENESLDDITYPEGEVMIETALDAFEDDYDEHLKMARDGLNSVNALQDTSMLIAPEIPEATRKDIALVRQVATTAAAGMGIDPAHLLPAGMDNNVGKPMSLNMEGFIKNAIVAMKAIWRVIIQICEYALGMFKMHFSIMANRLRRLAMRVNKLADLKNKPNPGSLKVKGDWWLLTANGGYPQTSQDLTDFVDNFRGLLNLFAEMTQGGTVTWRQLNGLFTGNPKQVLAVYEAAVTRGNEFLSDLLIEKEFEVAGQDWVSVNKLGGGYITIRNAAQLPGRYSKETFAIGKALVGTQAEWVNGPTAQKPDSVPAMDAMELKQVIEGYLNLFGGKNQQLLDKLVHMAGAQARQANAEVKDWAKEVDRLLDEGLSDADSAMLTELTALARTLVTYRFGAFAKFTRVAGDTIEAMQTYMDAHIDAMK